MRVLFVLPPIGGGAEVFVELAAGLRRGGRVEVEALVPADSRAHELDAGVRLHYYDVPPVSKASGGSYLLQFQTLWAHAVYRELRRLETEFDLVLVHLPWGLANLYAERRRRPLVGFADVCWSDSWPLFNATDPPGPHPAFVDWKLALAIHERTMRACDRLLAPSLFFRDHHAAKGLRFEVIPHGRDAARFRPARDEAERRALRERLGLPPGKKIVLAIGFKFALKGLHFFGELALRVRDDDVLFVCVGPPPGDFDHWRRLDPTLDRRLLVRESVPHQDMPAMHACADVYCSFTYFESFGLAAVEAMACGTPVVAHRATTLPELIDEGGQGRLFDVGDMAACEARVRELLADEPRRRALGAAGRARVLERFSLERMVAAYESYFERGGK